MAESKIDFSFENLHFSCEGDKDWVEIQLNQILSRIPGLNNPELAVKSEKFKPATGADISSQKLTEPDKKENLKRRHKSKTGDTLSTMRSSDDLLFEFLKEKDADKNQVKKFLATAVYLHSKGVEKFSTPMVSKLLKSTHIEKLINASDCLNKNEKKGFCIKEDKEFILTEAGIRSIIGGSEE
jgi:hypothetical protein